MIKLIDKRPNAGQMQVAHIMKLVTANATEAQLTKARNELDSIKKRVEAGEDFTKLAMEYSDDKNSDQNGGILPYFSKSGIVPEFGEASFALKKDGDLSEIIRTPYGLHLIKRIHLKPVPPFDDVKGLLTERLRSNSVLSQQKHDQFIKKLEESYTIQENEAIKSELLKSLHTDENKAKLATDEWLFKFDQTAFTANDFIAAWNKQSPERRRAVVRITSYNVCYTKLLRQVYCC